MVPGLRARALHLVFISWGYKKFLSFTLAGRTCVGDYSLPDIRFGEIKVEAGGGFFAGVKAVRPGINIE